MPSKDYISTRHAKDRVKDRGISEEEVKMIIKDAEIAHPGPRGDINMIKVIDGRKIKVAYIQEKNIKKVITVMIVS